MFVDMRALHRWVIAHSAGSGQLKLDAANLLAFMLLHEAGHITSHHADVEFSDGEMSQLNIDPTIASANEEKADRFGAVAGPEPHAAGSRFPGLAGRHDRVDGIDEAGLPHAGR